MRRTRATAVRAALPSMLSIPGPCLAPVCLALLGAPPAHIVAHSMQLRGPQLQRSHAIDTWHTKVPSGLRHGLSNCLVRPREGRRLDPLNCRG